MPGNEECCRPGAMSGPCPGCGTVGHPIGAITLQNHLPSERQADFGPRGSFCAAPACDVVYFNPGGKTIKRGQTVRPVTVKEQGGEVPVCYCFEFRRGDLRRDLEENGATGIPDEIKKGIKDGRCDCERKNPQGTCCLGNVAAAVKLIQQETARRR
ncbi:MAG: (2Fe-2S)-binding protein [Elusimicrobia bacterium]|nr:(2Fe-2S)-binding protein [Elusimicrobiota bacterium]